MVGARNASAAAIRFARELASGLSSRGAVVVSGLARGIDAAAHGGSISGGTVAVIAGGLDVAYPPEHAELQARIAAEGLLVAEQPLGVEPQARHFPRRNCIISGLSRGVVIDEAAPKSGSLITARFTAEQGREVMAVPGSRLDPRAQWCNALIRDGATLVQCADDVLETLSPIGASLAAPPRTTTTSRAPRSCRCSAPCPCRSTSSCASRCFRPRPCRRSFSSSSLPPASPAMRVAASRSPNPGVPAGTRRLPAG
jgi:DNA processing protein